MGEQFVDHYRTKDIRTVPVHRSGRATKELAHPPSQRIVLPERRAGEDKGMSRTVCSDGPGWVVRVAHLLQDRVLCIAESESPLFAQAVGVGSKHDRSVDGVLTQEIRRRLGNHQESTSRQSRSFGKSITDFPRKSVSTQILEEGVGVVDFHEFQNTSVGSGSRSVHDLSENEWTGARGWPKRFIGETHCCGGG